MHEVCSHEAAKRQSERRPWAQTDLVQLAWPKGCKMMQENEVLKTRGREAEGESERARAQARETEIIFDERERAMNDAGDKKQSAEAVSNLIG